MNVIDTHTHFFSDKIAKDPISWGQKHKEFHFMAVMSPRPNGKLIMQGFPDIKKFLNDMDDAGIERAIIQGWYWQNTSTCQETNDYISKIVKKHKDRLSAFASIQPADLEGSKKILENVINMGFIGIGELHDGVQNFSYASKNFSELASIMSEKNLPVCLHITDERGRNYPNKIYTDNDTILFATSKFPKLNFILAHWGGGDVFSMRRMYGKNVFFDSSATSLLYEKNAWSKASENAENQIVYGSDYPLRLYPKLFEKEEMKTFFNEAKLFIPSKSAEKFFYQNACNILFK